MSSDKELVKKIQEENCEKSFLELHSRHLPLCTNSLKKYWSLLVKMGYSNEEILHERDLAIFRAIRTYKLSSGGQVNTWIGNNVRYWYLNILKKFGKYNPEVPIKEKDDFESKDVFNFDYDVNDFVKNELQDLDPKVKSVFQDRYIYNKKLKDISQKHGITIAKASELSKIGRQHLRKKILESNMPLIS